MLAELKQKYKEIEIRLHPDCKTLLDNWKATKEKYAAETFAFGVRDKVIQLPLTYKSLSGTSIRKVYLPRYKDWGDILQWQLQENVCLLYTSPSPRDGLLSRMPSSA